MGVALGQLQVPLEHCWPSGQTVPQLPQLFVSEVLRVQNALALTPQASGVASGQ